LGDVRAGVDPYVPGGHAVHVALPAKLYCPGGHAAAVGVVDPAGHTYPAVQFPLQVELDKPEVLPKLPEGHALQLLAPVRLKVPGGHADTVEFVLPGGQAYPAVQGPEHSEDVWPAVDPNRPPSQGPLQEEVDSPGVDPGKGGRVGRVGGGKGRGRGVYYWGPHGCSIGRAALYAPRVQHGYIRRAA
jgi:hypothetical protein